MSPQRKLLRVSPSRISLIQTPTPLHRLNRLSKLLNLDLWIKRDDLTGLALGGNKGRKLEYLMASVLAERADIVVTCGASQSNFIRQLGAACAMEGVRCAAAIMSMPYDEVRPNSISRMGYRGNLVLDQILGIELHPFTDGTWDELYAHAENIALAYETQGLKTYRIPIGGSSALGAYAFYEASKEITEPFDTIVFASSSGSTQTGLGHGFRGTGTRVLGIACDPEPEIAQDFAELSLGLSREILGDTPLCASDYDLDFNYVGPGYGIPSAAGNAALELMARTEGIFLDPIYSAKAFSAVIDLAQKGSLTGKVLFWHTGGVPALFV